MVVLLPFTKQLSFVCPRIVVFSLFPMSFSLNSFTQVVSAPPIIFPFDVWAHALYVCLCNAYQLVRCQKEKVQTMQESYFFLYQFFCFSYFEHDVEMIGASAFSWCIIMIINNHAPKFSLFSHLYVVSVWGSRESKSFKCRNVSL